MAIVRIAEPANPPTAIGDWTQVIAMIRSIALGLEMPLRVVGSNVVKGAVFQVGGTLYQATSDTAISGTASEYVKLTPSGDGSSLSAAFVALLVPESVAWNSTYCGWYDSSGNLYIFDEGKAKTAGQIPAIMKNRDVTIPMGTGWLAALAVNIASGWSIGFASALGAYARTYLPLGTQAAWAEAILADLLTVDGSGSGLAADTLDGILHASTILGITAGEYIFAGPYSSSTTHDWSTRVTYKMRRYGNLRIKALKGGYAVFGYRVYINDELEYEKYPSATESVDIDISVGDVVRVDTKLVLTEAYPGSVSIYFTNNEEGHL